MWVMSVQVQRQQDDIHCAQNSISNTESKVFKLSLIASLSGHGTYVNAKGLDVPSWPSRSLSSSRVTFDDRKGGRGQLQVSCGWMGACKRNFVTVSTSRISTQGTCCECAVSAYPNRARRIYLCLRALRRLVAHLYALLCCRPVQCAARHVF